MNILALNAGSSSMKASLFHMDGVGVDGDIPSGLLWEVESGAEHQSLDAILQPLWSGSGRILPSLSAIDGVAHRVVHGGRTLTTSVRITEQIKAQIHVAAEYAPEHNAAALKLIAESEKLFGLAIPQVAVFDTAFHRTLPPEAYTYAGPYSWLADGIRRYGFHGISHQYVAERAKQLLKPGSNAFRLVSCHLGSGCSMAAIRDGVSIDTTMGFTPLDGLPMATRSGAVDPGILIHLLRHGGQSADSLDTLLNEHSGLAGLSGTNGDMREVLKAVDAGDTKAQLALDVFVHHARQGIASMAASLGGIDALAFTAGVGEHAPRVRELICNGVHFLGVHIDALRNNVTHADDRAISTSQSLVAIWVIRAQENWMIARECARIISDKD